MTVSTLLGRARKAWRAFTARSDQEAAEQVLNALYREAYDCLDDDARHGLDVTIANIRIRFDVR